MVNYNCEKCSFSTYLKTDYLRHLNKKRPCDAVKIIKPSTNTIIDNSYNITNINTTTNTSELDEISYLKQEIVNMNKTNTYPVISSKYIEKTTKFKLIANNINSIDINVINIFFLFKISPNTPIKNKATTIFKM